MCRSASSPGLILALAVMLTGCSDQKKTYPVTGKFVWPDGSSAKELGGSMVVFRCGEEQINAQGIIDEQGGLVMGTYKPGDGAVAGKHQVAVVLGSDDAGFKMQIVHPRYEDFKTSDLEVTVEPKPNEVVFQVEPGAWMKRKNR